MPITILLMAKLINRYGPCVGLTLFQVGRYKLELWVSPSDYSPPEHSHGNSDGEFFVLYGRDRCIWKRTGGNKISYNITGRNYWKWFSVRAGEVHKFETGGTPMIWLCWEKWKPGVKVTSVADDLTLA